MPDPAPVDEPSGRIRLTLQRGLWGAAGPGPWVRIDDTPVPTSPGENVVPVSAGRHDLAITAAYRFGNPARADVTVAPGEEVSLWYAPPFSRFDAGKIGRQPLAPRGRGFLLLTAAIIVVGLVVQALSR